MSVQYLKLTYGPGRRLPVAGRIPAEPAKSLRALKAEANDVPAVYVVRDKDLPRLRAGGDGIVDRGVKHKAKGLSAYLLGKRGIPLIDGAFSSPGQCLRSTRKLLANAVRRGEENVYVVGVDGATFSDLLTRAGTPPGGPDSRPPATASRREAAGVMPSLAGERIDRPPADEIVRDSATARALTMRAARRVECLRHLRKTQEVVRTCRAALEPCGGEGRWAPDRIQELPTGLAGCLEELGILCLRPLSFGSEPAFTAVVRLAGKLAYMLGLMGADPRQARDFWREGLESEFGLTLEAVRREIAELTEGAAANATAEAPSQGAA